MIDLSSSVKDLLVAGYTLAMFIPVTLQTDEITPKPIAALDVTILHKAMTKYPHDSKPWKTAVGVDNINQAQAQSEQFLSAKSQDTVLPGLMAELTVI